MKNKFQPLKSGEVICVANPVQFVCPHNTFRVSELADALKQELIKYSGYGVTEADLGWLSPQGSDCAVLKFGAPGWQKGKLRLKIEFCPDDSENGYSADDDYENDTAEGVSEEIKRPSLPSSNYASSDNDFPFDDFSLDPELDFIADSATVLEFSKPESLATTRKQPVPREEVDADILTQSIEDELNTVTDEEDDPFGEADNDPFGDTDDDFPDSDDNFGFGELGLDEESDEEENSDFDSVWQDL